MHDHVADLAGRAERSVVRATVKDQPAADARPEPQPEHVVVAPCGPSHPLAEQAHVGIVAQHDRHPQCLSDRGSDVGRSIPPGEVRHLNHLTAVHHTGDTQPDGPDVNGIPVGLGDGIEDDLDNRSGTLARRRSLGPPHNRVVIADQTDLDVGASNIDPDRHHRSHGPIQPVGS